MYRFRSRLTAVALAVSSFSTLDGDQLDRIKPYAENPNCWAYKGEPTLLLGGSVDDNLFQLPELESHLEVIAEAGANYVRNTMSDRPVEGFEVYPFLRLDDGRFDLEQWNPVYWERFANFLRWTHERDIIVQIEVWDRFDHSREFWEPSPYNPKNNINYTYDDSGFDEHYPEHPGRNKQPFFYTLPNQNNNEVVFPIQKAFVDKLLSHALAYGHVLYCMDNETSGDPQWGAFWSDYIHGKAESLGTVVYTTEMWDAWDLKSDEHRHTFDYPDRYQFVDVSQNNHISGQEHWDNFQWVRSRLSASPRPINTVKTYGAEGNKFGHTDRDGVERFLRHVIGGAASARFHRPPAGLGISEASIAAIQATRKLVSLAKPWDMEPAQSLLSEREENEAYLCADSGEAYVAYFTNGGSVQLDLTATSGSFTARWIDANSGQWGPTHRLASGAKQQLDAPGDGHWIAAIVRK